MSDSFFPFLLRPSIYPDEGIAGKYVVPYLDGVPDDLIEDAELVDSVLSFLDTLDLENNSEFIDVGSLRQELTSVTDLKKDIVDKVKEQTSETAETDSSEGSEEGGGFGAA